MQTHGCAGKEEAEEKDGKASFVDRGGADSLREQRNKEGVTQVCEMNPAAPEAFAALAATVRDGRVPSVWKVSGDLQKEERGAQGMNSSG